MAYNFPEEEKNILKFWRENDIFKKLQDKNKKGKPWSFLDGPITANNPMGAHHAWGRTYKDLFQRYKAMRGFNLRYQNGFDCQGLWVEVEVEKELGFKSKKDIEAYGIDKFVQKCKERVIKYSKIQTEQSVRLGQWMDWENSYYTMSDENNYAIWHFLKKCWQKGYLYKGKDSVPWCPRCATAISQHEILTEDYKKTIHESIYFRLPVAGSQNEYLLVWTTTPWTLPANVAVAVDKNMDYSLVEDEKGLKNWVAKDLADKIFKNGYKVLKTAKGAELAGLEYHWAFDGLPRIKEVLEKFKDRFHRVIETDERIMPINIEEGTGLVHTAVSAGQEDFQLGKKLNLPVVEIIDEEANYLDGLGEFSGKNAKKNPAVILDYLKSRDNFVFKIEPYKHRYPACWRCKTELVWRVVDEWYISMEKLRDPLEKIAQKINWIPSFGLDRELDWLKNMHDWLISKKRYWGLALPIFECSCGNFEVIGSKEELEKRAVEGWEKFEGNSPHRPWIDYIKIDCSKCGQAVGRIKDVGNPWLDAGIVPFSTMGYFFDKSYWKKWFPAQIICESFPGQFKNWFYSLLVMSAVLEDSEPVKTIFGYASVRDEKGQEMHKSKGNAVLFDEAVEKMGADPMRWLYMRHNPADNLNFSYKAADEIKRKLLTLRNVYSFFETYVDKNDYSFSNDGLKKADNILDKWILSKLGHLISLAEFNLEKYDVAKAVLAMEDFFVNDLSLWYTRRSRKRFRPESPDKKQATETLYFVLLNTAKIISPIMPFFAEKMYQNLKTDGMPESIHLLGWPETGLKTDLDLEQKMQEAREITSLALAQRSEKGIKVRQPLSLLKVKSSKFKILDGEILNIIKDEVNVKEIIFDDKMEKDVELDLNITEELKLEGVKREVIRFSNELRKEAGYLPGTVAEDIISSVSEALFDAQVLKEIGIKKFVKISDEKEIPLEYVAKKIKIEEGKTDLIAMPKNKN